MPRMIKAFFSLLCLLLLFSSASAHPGRTDSNGGHTNRSTGEYHYHNGGRGGNVPSRSTPSSSAPTRSIPSTSSQYHNGTEDDDENDYTLLMDAARYNPNPGAITDLINAGEDVNAQDGFGWTPLIYAAAYNPNPDVITTLTEAGAEVNARSSDGSTALILAANSNSNPEVVTALTKAGADLNTQGKEALIYAAIRNPNPEVVIALVKAGVDINADDNGYTPLMAAAENPNPQMAATILELEAKVRDRDDKIAINSAKENEELKDTNVFRNPYDVSSSPRQSIPADQETEKTSIVANALYYGRIVGIGVICIVGLWLILIPIRYLRKRKKHRATQSYNEQKMKLFEDYRNGLINAEQFNTKRAVIEGLKPKESRKGHPFITIVICLGLIFALFVVYNYVRYGETINIPTFLSGLIGEKHQTLAATSSEAATYTPTQAHYNTSAERVPSSTARQEVVSVSTVSTELNENLTVHYIDVGQADSILIELPNSQTMLIDGGNRADGTTVVNYLRDNGITTIDYLIATHPHEDHIGGLPDVIDSSIEIESIYMPRVGATTQIFEKLLTSIENKGLTINTAQAGVNILSIPGLQIDIVAPVGDSYSDLNDWSAAIKLEYKNTAFLFMGDAETISENQIYADIDADILKVGHHGSESSTSASFLQRVTPDYAVICVGKGNSYGHPDGTTLAALNNAGVEIFRTDEQGTIIIASDGDNFRSNKQPIPYSPNAPPVNTTTPTPPPAVTVTPRQPTQERVSVPSQTQNITVYVTRTGEKYHLDGCRYLRSRIPISLEDARRSYDPCSVCNPPR